MRTPKRHPGRAISLATAVVQAGWGITVASLFSGLPSPLGEFFTVIGIALVVAAVAISVRLPFSRLVSAGLAIATAIAPMVPPLSEFKTGLHGGEIGVVAIGWAGAFVNIVLLSSAAMSAGERNTK